MDETSKRRVIIGAFFLLLIALVIIAVVLVNNESSKIPNSWSSGIGFQARDLAGSGLRDTVRNVSDGNFSGILTVEPSGDCMLMALVDYRVVPFYYNGSYNTTHYLSGSSGNPKYSDSTYGNYTGMFSITNLSEGFHEVLFLGIVSPYNYKSTPGGSLTSGGSMMFDVVVGNATKPSVFIENRSTTVNAVYASGNGVFSTLSKTPFSNLGMYRVTMKPGTVFNYYVNVGHGLVDGEYRNTTLAIVQLLDYRQVPLVYGTGNSTYYGYIDRNENCSVYMSFKSPEAVGQHKLINIIVTDLYAGLEFPSGTMNPGITRSVRFEHLDITVT
jgi:hypothetical protein